MRVLIVDPDEARAALVAQGLADVKPLEVLRMAAFEEAEAAAFKPDVIVIASESPDRDTLESLREANVHNPRPVVMFVDRSAPGLAEAAAAAGAAAPSADQAGATHNPAQAIANAASVIRARPRPPRGAGVGLRNGNAGIGGIGA